MNFWLQFLLPLSDRIPSTPQTQSYVGNVPLWILPFIAQLWYGWLSCEAVVVVFCDSPPHISGFPSRSLTYQIIWATGENQYRHPSAIVHICGLNGSNDEALLCQWHQKKNFRHRWWLSTSTEHTALTTHTTYPDRLEICDPYGRGYPLKRQDLNPSQDMLRIHGTNGWF